MNDTGRTSPGRVRPRSSAVLHRIGDAGSDAFAGVVIGALASAWLAIGMWFRFPNWWQVTLYSFSAMVTSVMVFVIQHTQHRQVTALQRKLDELIRSTRQADNALISVEHASEVELQHLGDVYRDQRHEAVGD